MLLLKVKKLNKKINEFEEKNNNNIKDYKEEIEKLENETLDLTNVYKYKGKERNK